ncbi:MAG: hypothetical protein J5509_02880 [Lachnospiraceae bacterium]|nr:hypothetical protein [Lachnospiraceae bacterium]
MYDYPLNGRTYTVDEYEETLKDKPSDIEGMSQYDKYAMDLAIEDGSDTDMDGLTDKEEIEVYGSDPHKASTADDMYSDKYKVENGMDVHTYYDYDKEITFDRNECPEVILTAKTYTDLFATVTPMSEEFLRMRIGSEYDKYDFLKVYNVYNYNGNLSIKTDETGDVIVFVGNWTGDDLKNTHSKVENGVIDVKYDFEYGKNYVVIIAKKNGNSGLFGSKLGSEDGKAEVNHFQALIRMSYAAYTVGGPNATPHVYYTTSGNDAEDQALCKHIQTHIYDITDKPWFRNHEERPVVFTKVTMTEYNERLKTETTKEKFMSWHVRTAEFCGDEPGHDGFFYQFFEYDDIAGKFTATATVDGVDENGKSTRRFDVMQDALPFPNFGSYISEGGNCAGISHLTALIYNTGENPKTGEYTRADGSTTISWDISEDPENETLSNSGLYDYKTSAFVSEHSDSGRVLNQNLSLGEQQFVNMVGAYFAESNDKDRAYNIKYQRRGIDPNYSWKTVETMMEFLDQGKIIDVGFYTKTCGHALNIVGYTVNPNNSNEILFELYDNEFPKNARGDHAISNTLHVIKEVDDFVNETFTYSYKPYDECKTEFSSGQNRGDSYIMVLYDENFNLLNADDIT